MEEHALHPLIQELPPRPGAYVLVLHLEAPLCLPLGSLGNPALPAGYYVYLGQARGPGGVRARLGRHLRGVGRPRWHIDFLRARARPVAWGWRCARARATAPWECRWSQHLAGWPEARLPVPRFGASDCRRGCPAHLWWLPADRVGDLTRALGLEHFWWQRA